MIEYVSGDIFDSGAQAIVNPVNCVGVAGAGLARKFRQRYPENYSAYQRACKIGLLRPGGVFVFETEREFPQLIVNMATKGDWRLQSEYHWIVNGVYALQREVKDRSLESVSIPRIGAGLGGLRWYDVKKIIELVLSSSPDCHYLVYGR